MRIISGRYKGRSLVVPKNFAGRPTTDFAREGLFNVLNHLIDFSGIRVLDMFAGTGAFGIECLSRGAEGAKFIEMSGLHAKFIADNIRQFDLKQAQVVKGDVFRVITTLREKYDLIFADPPYDLNGLNSIPELVFQSELLLENGIFVLEHGREYDFSEHRFFLQHRKYSNVHFSFFSAEVSDEEE